MACPLRGSPMSIEVLLSQAKTYFNAVGFDVPANWIVFNAPRPLVGHKTFDGDFVCGRFYAAVDPSAEFAADYVRQNLELDARIAIFAPLDVQLAMALDGHKYRDHYLQLPTERQAQMKHSLISKVQGLLYPEAIAKLERNR